MNEPERLRHAVDAIIEQPTFDWPAIKEYRVGRVRWIGRPGYSDSIEAWIWHTARLIKRIPVLSSSEHWFARCWSSTGVKNEHSLAFAFHYCPTPTVPQGELIACAGATNYSGSGGHARDLAETFIAMICNDASQGVVRIIDHDMGYLIEYLLGE